MKVDYFTEDEPKTKRHKWLVYYYRYLFTPDAGFHQDKNRLQHASQVKTILFETDPTGDDIAFLAEEEGNRVWVDWVVPNINKKAAGTLKSYLTSLQKFLEYVTKKGTRSYLPPLEDETKNTLFDVAVSLKGWRRYITKETASEKWEKYLNECDTLLTNKEVEDIITSKPALEGRKALMVADTAEDPDDLSVAQYCAARDFLVTTLTRTVGTRPGPLENATLHMFKKAQWDDKKRVKVMLVTSHKREEDGPAPIAMGPDTVHLMQVFLDKLRPVVTDDNTLTGKIFLKADGTPFSKGTIGRRVSAFVVKSGIRPDTLITSTDFRKWVVTEMQRKKRRGIKIDEDLLRRIMCHSDKTAKSWYIRESLTELAAEASEQIAANTQPSPKKKSLDQKEEESEPEEESPSPPKKTPLDL